MARRLAQVRRRHLEAHRLTKENRWDDLAALVDDDVLDTLAVMGDLDAVGRGLHERFAGLADRISLSIPYQADEQLPLDVAASCSAWAARI